MSTLLFAAASGAYGAKIHTPHIDYLSILPILIMMGGAVLLVTVSSLFRQVMGVGSATFLTVGTAIATLVAALFQWDHVATHGPSVTIAGSSARPNIHAHTKRFTG